MIRIEHLETDVTTACQLRCIACNHFVPLWAQAGTPRTTPAIVGRDLNRLATMLHADAWGALGGEPLLHPELVSILRAVRRSGVADRIEVWTNGLLLHRQDERFWQAFDVLVLSVYKGKLSERALVEIDERCRDFGVELLIHDERVRHNFRALLDSHPPSPARTRSKWNACFFRNYSRVANAGFFFTCCCAPHAPVLLRGQPFGTDGIEIATATEDSIRAYLERVEPLGSCIQCGLAEPSRRMVEWREVRDPVQWLAASRDEEAMA